MSRIFAEETRIDPERVKAFFDNRAAELDAEHPLTSVLYQQQQPELAAQRDAHERSTVLPLLRLEPAHAVLDVGCGIGRWAEAVLPYVAAYRGVDVAADFVAAARQRVPSERAAFLTLAAEAVAARHFPDVVPFDRVLVAGVLLYLNDDAAEAALHGIAECSGPGTVVYLREPVGVSERLTLVEHWSADLDSSYDAIYRTEDQLRRLLEGTLGRAGFRQLLSRDLYPEALNNRSETRQRIFLWARD